MSDFQIYQKLQTTMHSLIKSGQIDSPEFFQAWQRAEEIKSRHGGFPPSPEDYEAENMEMAEEANLKGTR